ncbi:YdeI/OmpD-associated family protein [Streptomyces sp. NBC_00893]|uniref:YdeI/OmpD-associated family protein n=1 Tax=Streptomyces sp. NBC_00893 TaxID=2975862 RepID=UPI0033900346
MICPSTTSRTVMPLDGGSGTHRWPGPNGCPSGCGSVLKLWQKSTGRMREPGPAEVRRAQQDGRWAAAYESQRTATAPPDLVAALDADPGARKAFEALDRSGRLPADPAVAPGAHPGDPEGPARQGPAPAGARRSGGMRPGRRPAGQPTADEVTRRGDNSVSWAGPSALACPA